MDYATWDKARREAWPNAQHFKWSSYGQEEEPLVVAEYLEKDWYGWIHHDV